MPLLSRLIYGLVSFAARKGLAEQGEPAATDSAKETALRARRTGVRGETYAYWYLRRHGYIFIARNYMVPGVKGEIDLIGYDGPVLAFVEVKTRSTSSDTPPLTKPEDAVTHEKRRNLSRMASHFLRDRHLPEANCRFDVLAIESHPGQRPVVRLHKAAF